MLSGYLAQSISIDIVHPGDGITITPPLDERPFFYMDPHRFPAALRQNQGPCLKMAIMRVKVLFPKKSPMK